MMISKPPKRGDGSDTRTLPQVLQETRSGTTLSYLTGVSQYDPSQTGQAQWAYFHQDAQNNRALSDGGAAVGKRWEYEPFGVLRTQSGTASSDFQYAGEQKDSETGLINLRARYYDPVLGRFISRDLLSGHAGFTPSWNRYVYAFNNPLILLDSSGYAPMTYEQLTFAAHQYEMRANYLDWIAAAHVPLAGLATVLLEAPTGAVVAGGGAVTKLLAEEQRREAAKHKAAAREAKKCNCLVDPDEY